LLPQGRQAVLNQLLSQPATTTKLLDAFASAKIDTAVLSLEQIAALRNHAVADIRTKATELLAAKGSSPNPDRQKVYNEILPVASMAGNAARGKELFTKNCAVCHMHGGVGETIAPDLTGMFVHPKKDILANVIDPSKDVEANFRSQSVVANGKTYVGMFAGESATTVTIVDSTGKRQAIQRNEIDEIFSSNKSLMPDGFEKVLSQSEIADVLEFLATPQKYVPLRLSSIATTSTVLSPDAQFGGRGGRNRGGRGQGQNRGRGDGGRGQRDGQAAAAPGFGQDAAGAAVARGGDRRGRGLAGGGRQGRGRGGRGRGNTLITLADWKPITVNGVPFTLVNPQEGAVKNVLLFGSDVSQFSQDLPTTVRLPCGMAAKTIHLLSGVSIGGHPAHAEQSTSLTVRLHYQGGATEDHELKNGVHFANVEQRNDVPQSEFAFESADGQQMRHLKITPARADVITDIEFIKGSDPTVPIVLAATAEVK
jgi:putative heme-binding domain-containing protein